MKRCICYNNVCPLLRYHWWWSLLDRAAGARSLFAPVRSSPNDPSLSSGAVVGRVRHYNCQLSSQATLWLMSAVGRHCRSPNSCKNTYAAEHGAGESAQPPPPIRRLGGTMHFGPPTITPVDRDKELHFRNCREDARYQHQWTGI